MDIEEHSAKPHVPEEARRLAINLLEEGYSYPEVQKELKLAFDICPHHTTLYRIWKHFTEEGAVEDRPKSGRKPTYNPRECRAIERAVLQDPTLSSVKIANDPNLNPKGVTANTIRNILTSLYLYNRVYKKGDCGLSPKDRKARKKFGKDHLGWSIMDWEGVIFSDESDLEPQVCGEVRVWTKDYYSLTLPSLVPTRNLTIKVWGAISKDGVGPLIRYFGNINGKAYREILHEGLVNYYGDALTIPSPLLGRPLVLQADNAKPHGCKLIDDYKDTMNLSSLLNWPSYSPDLNPIENVWSYIEDSLYYIQDSLKNQDDVWEKVQKIWFSISPEQIKDLYACMPERMEKVIETEGFRIN